MKFVEVVQWSTKGGEIRLEMLDEDRNAQNIEVSSDCAGVLAAALAAALEKLGAGDRGQIMRPTGMQTAKTQDGEPMVLLSLKGGAELPLVFKPESLAVLISELQGLMRDVRPGSEVRWN